MSRLYKFLSCLLPLLAFLVVIKGAYVRLNDAGLGCPDWPGCYGHLLVPKSESAITNPAHLAARPLEQGKAWAEMIHRYLASTLGMLILALAACAWWRRAEPLQPTLVPALLVPLVVFQGLLGMWTVTLLLKPLIVTGHLLFGIATFALLVWNLWAAVAAGAPRVGERFAPMVAIAIVVLSGQIFLGGWTSTNYAALACTDFPTCQGSFWPNMDFGNAFVLWRGLGVNYEFGVLETPARTAIHFSHRVGALFATGVILLVGVQALRSGSVQGRRTGLCILAVLAMQVALGIANVLEGLPLPVAVMHNGGAALLMGGLVSLLFFATRPAGPAGLAGR